MGLVKSFQSLKFMIKNEIKFSFKNFQSLHLFSYENVTVLLKMPSNKICQKFH